MTQVDPSSKPSTPPDAVKPEERNLARAKSTSVTAKPSDPIPSQEPTVDPILLTDPKSKSRLSGTGINPEFDAQSLVQRDTGRGMAGLGG
ncbi:hypothetical protein BN14_05828 [Rhizoctonia solani AG-1 IB]|uniref:Uncharacterized protein n=1 Tax=Thanatephorus cucumeris (strain AG1-IB / isolate 7/3/14) TaxID=1108050 RepID=M5BVR4_THACB|nr:hypothetical protein BN14_05828 [Rhizoctonia solani AG-1 IB]